MRRANLFNNLALSAAFASLHNFCTNFSELHIQWVSHPRCSRERTPRSRPFVAHKVSPTQMSIRLETGQMRTEHDRREIYPRMPATSIAADSTECFSSHKPLGSERLPATNLLSLRGEKRDQLQNRRCLTLQFDRYNAVNANSATTVSFASGAVWGDIGHPAELSSRTFCTFAREFSPFTVSLAPQVQI